MNSTDSGHLEVRGLAAGVWAVYDGTKRVSAYYPTPESAERRAGQLGNPAPDVALHVTATEQNLEGGWFWHCRCGAYGGNVITRQGYTDQQFARLAGDRHLAAANAAWDLGRSG